MKLMKRITKTQAMIVLAIVTQTLGDIIDTVTEELTN